MEYNSEKFLKHLSKVKEYLPISVVERIKLIAPKASATGIATLLIHERVNIQGNYSVELQWLYKKVTGKDMKIL